MFLKVDGIPGESLDAKHKGEIDIESFSWGLSRPPAAPGAGGGATGRVVPQDFSFTSPVSKASPKLFLACAQSQHIKSAHITVRKTGAQQQDFLKLTMSDVTVSSYVQVAGDGTTAGVPLDQVSMSFGKLEVSYSAQRPDGTLDAPVTGAWDFKKSSKS